MRLINEFTPDRCLQLQEFVSKMGSANPDDAWTAYRKLLVAYALMRHTMDALVAGYVDADGNVSTDIPVAEISRIRLRAAPIYSSGLGALNLRITDTAIIILLEQHACKRIPVTHLLAHPDAFEALLVLKGTGRTLLAIIMLLLGILSNEWLDVQGRQITSATIWI
jgi:hypothetical protein